MKRWLAPALLLAAARAGADTRETVGFRLYKMQNPVGVELSTVVHGQDGTTEIRTNFTFTDRATPVPLAATLRLGKDGAPLRFQAWGQTSRSSEIDDAVTVAGRTITVERTGVRRTAVAPPVFFVASAYAPIIVTEALFGYWQSRGRPKVLPVFPAGEVRLERRGIDDITDDDGKGRRLERYALAGLGWGHETIWIDDRGRLAALKGVDTEFDHFEATRLGYQLALPRLIASAAADGLTALEQAAPPAVEGRSAWVGATLIDGTGAAPVPDAVVVVEAGRVVAAGPRAKVAIPPGARVVDVEGKTLLPGLWDMHAHFEQAEWGPLYLAAGVTTVRDCGNELPFIQAAAASVAAGKGLGPRILLACIVDGDGPAGIGVDRLRDAREIPGLVRKLKDAGCAQVKIYQSLNPTLIAPLARAAHEAGMSVTGHVPTGIGLVHAVEAGMDQISHVQFVVRALLPPSYQPDDALPQPIFDRALDELDVASAPARRTLAFLAARHVVVDPTLALAELFDHGRDEIAALEPGLAKVAPELRAPLATLSAASDAVTRGHRRWAAKLATVRALHRAGVTVVAGTDQGIPGHSVHRELELYVEAGFTPMEAIQAATIVPARAMHLDSALGTIEAGKRADFIVVDGDPLADVHALRRTVTVVTGGRAYDTATLWRSVGFTP